MTRDDNPGGPVLLESAHGPQPGFQSPMVVLDRVVGMLDCVVKRPGQYLVEHRREVPALSVTTSAGSRPFALIALTKNF